MKINKLFIVTMATVLATSCAKQPGEGGKTTIKGKLVGDFYCEENGEFIGQEGFVGERVYITYGEGSTFDDDVRTGEDGSFSFSYLYPGDYTLTALADCYTCPSEQEVVSTVVTVSKNDNEIDAGELVVKQYTNDNCPGPGENGQYTLKGKLTAVYIDRYSEDTLGTGPLKDERVYIIYGDGDTHSDDERTSADGSYQFTELRPGDYRLYAYSECEFCLGGTEPTYVSVSIPEDTSEPVEAPEINVVILD